MTLVEALPDDALLRTTPEYREARRREGEWDTTMELLAQILEEVSVLSADMRRKKPLDVPRPSYLKAAAENAGQSTNAYAAAIDRLLGGAPAA